MLLPRRVSAAALALAFAAVGAACAGHKDELRATPPAHGVTAWSEAVERDDPAAAYALLSRDVQKQIPFDEFTRRWKESKVERTRQAAAMKQGAAEEGPAERATVKLPDGKLVSLEAEENGWRLESPLLSSQHAGTPEDALRIFAGAIEGRSYEGVMRILTSTRRDGIGAELLGPFVSGIKAHVGDAVEVNGDRATFRFSDGRHRWKITLKKEGDEWKIDDVVQQQ